VNEPRPRILLVEDDINLGSLLKDSLERAGFETALAVDGEEGFALYRGGDFDLALIDVMLPRKDGFALARDIRKVDPEIPLVFLTARTLKDDRVAGFKIGADDYVTKPFNLEELILRLRAVLKRARPRGPAAAGEILSLGRYSLDTASKTLSLGRRTRSLTPKETDLLLLFARNVNTIVERNAALELIWGRATPYNTRSMDVFISRLRTYLKGDPDLEIQNIHGVGYKLIFRPRRPES
jgi:two-component system OmpR family response regulator